MPERDPQPQPVTLDAFLRWLAEGRNRRPSLYGPPRPDIKMNAAGEEEWEGRDGDEQIRATGQIFTT